MYHQFYRSRQRCREWSIALVVAVSLATGMVSAQMSGTYTVGPGGNYPTIEAAIGALNNSGSPQVTGAVTFLVQSGYYIPPAGRYLLGSYSGMSATNTVTFRPDVAAEVVVRGSLSTAIFDINGGDFFVIDGSNVPGGSGRNWRITNSSTGGSVLRFVNGATNNIVRNLELIGSGSSSNFGVVKFDGTGNGVGNSDNLVAGNLIGDSEGLLRANAGVYMTGSSAAPNLRNRVEGNEVINFGYGSSVGYGIYISSNNHRVKIVGNHIHGTVLTGTQQLFPMYGVYYNNANNLLDTISGNRIHGLGTLNTTAAQYGLYVASQGNSPVIVRNNMISLQGDQGILAGIYHTRPDTLYCDHNTICIGGKASVSTTSYAVYNSAASKLWLRNNIFVNQRVSSGKETNRLFHLAAVPATLVSNNNLLLVVGSSTAVGYRAGVITPTLTAWQQGTGLDMQSLAGEVNFADSAVGDLHINSEMLFAGESMGLPLDGAVNDIDGELRDMVHPDCGADEGDFNAGSVRLLAPNGGERFVAGDLDTVRWMHDRATNVRLEYSVDGGLNWLALVANGTPMPAFLGACPWLVPDVTTDRALVRIVNNDKPQFSDISDHHFIIGTGVITLLAPAANASYELNQEVEVMWAAGNVRGVNIDYSSDAGRSWQRVASDIPSSAGRFRFIPPALPTDLALVRLVDIDRSRVNARSPEPFRIRPAKSITVDAPATGDRLLRGSTVEILWNAVGVARVKVLVTTDGGRIWEAVAANLPAAQGSILWKLPIIPTTAAKVWVQEVGGVVAGESGVFAIVDSTVAPPRATPTLRILYPNGGESFPVDTTITLGWDAKDLSPENLQLDYTIDDGISWQPIAILGATARSHRWRVPGDTTHRAILRVRTESNSAVDLSDTHWSIRSIVIVPPEPIVLLVPNGGESWRTGVREEVLWLSPDDVASVAIEFSTDGGAHWMSMASPLPTYGSIVNRHQWTLPALDSGTVTALVRVSSADNPERSDISDSPFGITVATTDVDHEISAPTGVATATNHPNPFSAFTEVRWVQPAMRKATLRVISLHGELHTSRDLGLRPPGEEHHLFDGRGLPAGVYYYEIWSGGVVGRGRMVVVR